MAEDDNYRGSQDYNDWNAKRYSHLPPEARAFIETLDGPRVVALANMIRFYDDLTPETKSFLLNANKETVEFLKGLRPAEVQKLNDGIQLVQASRTVGKTVFYLVSAFLGSMLLLTQIGSWVSSGLAFLRGGK